MTHKIDPLECEAFIYMSYINNCLFPLLLLPDLGKMDQGACECLSSQTQIFSKQIPQSGSLLLSPKPKGITQALLTVVRLEKKKCLAILA